MRRYLLHLATCASTDNLNDEEMELLLLTYFETDRLEEGELLRFKHLRALADLRWAAWYYLQTKIPPPASLLCRTWQQIDPQHLRYPRISLNHDL